MLSLVDKQLIALKKEHTNSPLLEQISELSTNYEKELNKKKRKKEQKLKKNNQLTFKKLINNKDSKNELSYFNSLSIEEQNSYISKMELIKANSTIEKPYRFKILELDIPLSLKSFVLKKVTTLKYMEPGASEYYKIKNWLDTFMSIPFNKYNSLNLTLSDGKEKCNSFIQDSVGNTQ